MAFYWMDALQSWFGFENFFESEMVAARISFSKAMNTITTRPFLTMKLATFAALILLFALQSI